MQNVMGFARNYTQYFTLLTIFILMRETFLYVESAQSPRK